MIIRLSEIDNEVTIRGDMDGSRFVNQGLSDFRFVTPVAYHMTVKKIDKSVRIRGSIDCTLMLSCSRCLDLYEFPVSTEVDMELEPVSMVPDAHELELRKEEMDVTYFEGDEIDLEPLVYEEILLTLPMMPLCKDDCQGICDICGKNRNSEVCACRRGSQTLLGEKLQTFLK